MISSLELLYANPYNELIFDKSKFNEYEPIIDKEKIKLLDDTVKYYKEVLDKLNYINILKKIATVN